jgi:phosphate transport system substrate-binding protein
VQQWTADFKSKCSGTTVNYGGAGSGAGITSFEANQLDFAGSDAPIAGADVAKATAVCATGGQAINIPMVVGPIAMAYNLSGVSKLTLTPTVIAQIFTGKITTWNDPAIAAANKGVTLPSSKISVVTRSDSSGTSFNFSSYLHAVDPTDFTAAAAKQWPVPTVGTGAAKTTGVAQAIKNTPGAFGYLELSSAQDAGVGLAQVDSGAGAVTISASSASKFMATATVSGTAPDLTLTLDYTQKGAGVYPIVLVTYEITCTKYKDATKAALVKSFLTYTSGGGQAGLADLGYAPLPSSLQKQVQSAVTAIS